MRATFLQPLKRSSRCITASFTPVLSRSVAPPPLIGGSREKNRRLTQFSRCFHAHRILAQAASSPFDKKNRSPTIQGKKQRSFVPRKAAVQLTPSARTFFQKLLADPPRPGIVGIQLCYGQSGTGQPRMVFSFRFVTQNDLGPNDEGVSLEVLEDGTPKPPAEAAQDGLPKLYVQGDAFLKVLGATVDVDKATFTPVLYDKEGNKMDPNA